MKIGKLLTTPVRVVPKALPTVLVEPRLRGRFISGAIVGKEEKATTKR